MKKEINEICDLVLDFGEKLYPLLYALKEECGDKPIPEFISEETKRDVADIKRMLAKQMAKESFQAPAYLDCGDCEEDCKNCEGIAIKKGRSKFPITESDEDDEIERSKSFYLRQEHMLAIADLSRINKITVQEYLNQEVLGTWFFFNRLNVPKGMRRKGIAKKLLYKVAVWADNNQYNILNVINPSGDMTMKQLTALYEKFGFEKISRGLMVRKHVVQVENIYDDVEEDDDEDYTDHVDPDEFINDQEKNEFFNGHLKGK